MMWLWILAVLSPETLLIQGYPGAVVTAEITTTQKASIEATYPLELLSYENSIATFKITTNAQKQAYNHTTYVIAKTENNLKTGIGVHTQTHILTATHQTQKEQPLRINGYIILALILSILAITSVRISLR